MRRFRKVGLLPPKNIMVGGEQAKGWHGVLLADAPTHPKWSWPMARAEAGSERRPCHLLRWKGSGAVAGLSASASQ